LQQNRMMISVTAVSKLIPIMVKYRGSYLVAAIASTIIINY